MGQVNQVNGDYTIKTSVGGTILLDTGPKVGYVRVTGSLLVDGETLTVSATNFNIKDNVITLNYDEQNAGVSLLYSGIQIDRGTLDPASFVFDEGSDAWVITQGDLSSGFNFSNSKLRLRSVVTNSDTDDGDLTLIGFGTGVIKVIGTTDYEDQVTDDDDIPNKKYVDDAIEAAPSFQLIRDNTRVIAFDTADALNISLFPIGPYTEQPLQDEIAVIVNNRRVALFNEHQFELRGLTIFAENPQGSDITGFPASPAVTLQATNTNTNIRLETTGSGKVQVTYALQMDNVDDLVAPTPQANTSVVYSNTPRGGGSGVYATNTTQTGELILTNRALLFSMIF